MQNHQADSPLYVWPDVWSADLHLLIKSMVIHDTECPYRDQVSLNNTNQTKPKWSMWPMHQGLTISTNWCFFLHYWLALFTIQAKVSNLMSRDNHQALTVFYKRTSGLRLTRKVIVDHADIYWLALHNVCIIAFSSGLQGSGWCTFLNPITISELEVCLSLIIALFPCWLVGDGVGCFVLCFPAFLSRTLCLENEKKIRKIELYNFTAKCIWKVFCV